MALEPTPVLGCEMQQAIIDDCSARLPHQACGLILCDEEGVARSVEPMENHGAWPYGFAISPQGQFAAFKKARANGWTVRGVYHCHLVSEAIPTGRDLKRPVPTGFLYVIASMLDPARPGIRAYLLDGGAPREVKLPSKEVMQ